MTERERRAAAQERRDLAKLAALVGAELSEPAPQQAEVDDDPGPARYISLSEVGANVRHVRFG